MTDKKDPPATAKPVPPAPQPKPDLRLITDLERGAGPVREGDRPRRPKPR